MLREKRTYKIYCTLSMHSIQNLTNVAMSFGDVVVGSRSCEHMSESTLGSCCCSESLSIVNIRRCIADLPRQKKKKKKERNRQTGENSMLLAAQILFTISPKVRTHKKPFNPTDLCSVPLFSFGDLGRSSSFVV